MPKMSRETYQKRKAMIERLVVFPSTETRPAEFRFHGKQIFIISNGKIKSKRMVRLIACWYFIKYYGYEQLSSDETDVIKTNIEEMMVDEYRPLIFYTPQKGKTIMRIEDPVFLLDNVLQGRFGVFSNLPFCITIQNFDNEFELYPYKLQIAQ